MSGPRPAQGSRARRGALGFTGLRILDSVLGLVYEYEGLGFRTLQGSWLAV